MNLTIQNISKKYPGDIHALKNISLDIHSGMFGLVGPNGAGKTTLMKIVTTLMTASSGDVAVDGLDLNRRRSKIRHFLGYLPQDFDVSSNLTAQEYLDYCYSLSLPDSRAKRHNAVDAMLEKVGLSNAANLRAKKLSGGMKRRLGIAQALIGNPRLLVVDEPTVGLDPEERLRFRNIIADLACDDRIIILSTHIVGDISSTCTDMALLDHGEIAFRGKPSELIELAKGHSWRLLVGDTDLKEMKERYSIISTIPSGEGWTVEIVGDNPGLGDAVPIEPNLEHAYVYYLENCV